MDRPRTTTLWALATVLVAACVGGDHLEIVAGELDGHPEPQALDPARDAALITELGLDGRLTSATHRVNVLLIGQDARNATENLADGRPGLSSRADAIAILSLHRDSGELDLVGLYRGFVTPPSCWEGLPLPPTIDRILGNLYRLGGRRRFVPCVESLLTTGLPRNADRLLTDGRFRIDAIVEVDFGSFRALIDSALDSVVGWDLFGVAWTYVTHTPQIIDIGRRRDDILAFLRERESYAAGGYQRAYNHLKFIATALGYLGYGVHHDGSMLTTIEPMTLALSRSATHASLAAALSTTAGAPALAGACYRAGVSPIRLVLLGGGFTSRPDVWTLDDGVVDASRARTTTMRRIASDLAILPAPNDCE